MLIPALANRLFCILIDILIKISDFEKEGIPLEEKFKEIPNKIWELLFASNVIVNDIELVFQLSNEFLRIQKTEMKSVTETLLFNESLEIQKTEIESVAETLPINNNSLTLQEDNRLIKYIKVNNFTFRRTILNTFITRDFKIGDARKINESKKYHSKSAKYMLDRKSNKIILFGKDVLYDRNRDVNSFIFDIYQQRKELWIGKSIWDETKRYEFILDAIYELFNETYQYVFRERFHHLNPTFPASKERIVLMYSNIKL